MHKSDLRITTVPVSGLQYSTSPSLPTAVKAMGLARDATTNVNTVFSSSMASPAGSPGPLPQSTLDLYDRFYSSLPGTEPARHSPPREGSGAAPNTATHHQNRSKKKKNSPNGGRDAGQPNWSASLTLPDALSSIGPSARRLLQLDAAQRHDAVRQHGADDVRAHASSRTGGDGDNANEHRSGGSTNIGTNSTLPAAIRGAPHDHAAPPMPTRVPVVPALARTLPVYTGKMKSTPAYDARAATMNGAAADSTYSATNTASRRRQHRKGNAHDGGSTAAARASLDIRPPLLSSTITNSGAGHTARATEAAAPSLVTQLHAYIQRELIRSTSGSAAAGAAGSAPSVLDQLSPYREAFRALCSAFPAYASLMSDIQSAYDNVIQAQAELLTDAYAAMTVRDVERSSNQELVTTLHHQVNNLQEELKGMEAALETRALAEAEERMQTVRQRPRSAQLTDAIELRRELDAAQQRIGDLEHHSQGDLEKIVILIGAVRECDRRLKEYERIVAGVTGQVSELDEFKRIAGEAQAELQLFRKKYADYVPVTDFQLMKEYLAAELEAAQLLTRRWRRTAAVRGTQLDVMQRRLATLEEERAAMVAVAEGAGETQDGEVLSPTRTAAALRQQVLTPRPSWSKIHAELPELAEYAANLGPLTTANDQLDDAAAVAAAAGDGPAASHAVTTGVSSTKSLPIVTGPKETALQVEYLVQRVRTLEAQLQQRRLQPAAPPQQLSTTTKQSSVQITEEGSASLRANSVLSSSPLITLETGEGKQRNSTSMKPAAAASTTAPAPTSTTSKPVEGAAFTRRASRRAQHRFSEGFQGSPTSTHGNLFMPVLAPPLTLPLVGLGYGPEVPVYLRASGVVPRRPVPPSTIVSLVYHFFLDVLPAYMDQQDEAAATGKGSGGSCGTGSGDRLGTCLYEYLQSEMATREDLKGYDTVAHLMLNLIRDGESQEWYGDALHVLLWTVQGVLPPRVAVDAAVVVAQVRRDVRALAKEQQSSRLRRQALSECLQPVLELKSASEVAELRAALGGETTFSVDALCGDGHPFMEVLLVQECRASAELYVTFVAALSARATAMVSRAPSASVRGAAAAAKATVAPPPPKLEEGDRVVTLANVAAAIQEVEPQTPDIVVRELSVNAAAASGKPDLLKTPPTFAAAAGSTSSGAGAGDGGAAAKSAAAAATAAEEGCVVVRLSDIVRAIAAAPLIRRSQQLTPENCVL